jgi:hypothetical protein
MTLAAQPARADVIQLGFILDGSGSIGSSNWNIIRQGLADAVATYIPVGGDDTYEISVVQFGSSATTHISNFVVSDAAARTALATQIAGLAFMNGGSTNYAAAFTAMANVLDNTIANVDASYVNFATDGQQNSGGTGQTQFANLLGIGVDNVSVEGIGNGVDKNDLMTNFCYPGPCVDTQPFNFPGQGFYIGVPDAQAYVDAIKIKISTVTGVPIGVPEPATLALFGTGLLGLAALRRRRAV